MTEPPPRRRAPGMSIEQRRAVIVTAALPLVTEYGAAVTTSKIARAAGIGEATIFRVFADKDELLDACVAEAMNPDRVLDELASIPLEEPLDARLVEAIEALRAHLERMGAVIGAMYASGGHRSRGGTRERREPGGREAFLRAIHERVTELIEPDRAALRLEPDKVGSILLGMLFARHVGPAGSDGEGDAADARPSPREVVDVLLHGVARKA
ncbi:TetR/AcrR family transcriptional regulator [Sphaerimonospora cavernae]|uniref:TetR/AcrR family transcriptional regulator n=1 Tax=Sphaerimonospora cavernae TaxID=1740611 RepID=A0ABV6UDB2_9ACTN